MSMRIEEHLTKAGIAVAGAGCALFTVLFVLTIIDKAL